MNTQITDFVHDALERGVTREDIRRGLLEGGWSSKEINAALDAFVDCGLPLPVPRKRVSGSAKEAFLFLMLFSAMYTTLFALGSVLFDLINLYLPIPGEMTFQWVESLRYGMATVVVAFPIFLFMSRVIRRDAVGNPGQRISPVRRWLTYLTLFIASTSLVADLITLVVRFLSGDLTLRFGLKILAVGLLAGIVLIYYLKDLRRDELAPSAEYKAAASRKLATAALATGILVILGVGFWTAGSPVTARMYAQDEERVRDLANISQKVQLYYDNKGSLPGSLDACDINPNTAIEQKTDRVTGNRYEYRVIDATHFEVGATFASSSRSDNAGAASGTYPGIARRSPGFWRHGPGPRMFTVEAAKRNIR